MPLSDKDFIERIACLSDPPLLCELLDISSEDLLEAFEDRIEDRKNILREIFDVDTDEYILYDG
jgi:hypothetical protein|tara:strand:- start:189 stop:380 length:192 start_codon:yes stop_codon:yes gene_type:complete